MPTTLSITAIGTKIRVVVGITAFLLSAVQIFLRYNILNDTISYQLEPNYTD